MNNFVGILICILLTVIIGTTVFMGGDGTVEGTMKDTIKSVNSEITDIVN